MNIFAHTMIVMSYALGISIFQAGESHGFMQPTIQMDKCSFEQVSQTSIKHSSYIKEITQEPPVFHTSEPIRISVQVNVTKKELRELPNTWITIHLLPNASVCFASDQKKTKTMQRKSDYLQEQLQTRINEGKR